MPPLSAASERRVARRGVAEALDGAGTVFIDHDILDQTLAVALQVFADGLVLLAVRRDGFEHRVRRSQRGGKIAVGAAQAEVAADRRAVALGKGGAEAGGLPNKCRDKLALDHVLQGAERTDIDLAVLLGDGVEVEAGDVDEVLALGGAAALASSSVTGP